VMIESAWTNGREGMTKDLLFHFLQRILDFLIGDLSCQDRFFLCSHFLLRELALWKTRRETRARAVSQSPTSDD